MLQDHHKNKPVIVADRLKFHSRICQLAKSVSTYITRLKELSELCKIGQYLDDMLRDINSYLWY